MAERNNTAAPTAQTGASEDAPFTISREFDAPRELVWRVCTQPEHMQHWFGPKGMKVIKAEMDLRPGGTYHYAMATPDGPDGSNAMWGKFIFQEIDPPALLKFIQHFSDENGGITRHPLSATWPLKMQSTFLFTESGGKTKFEIQWFPLDASAEELKTFNDARAGMMHGWGGTLEQLEAYLKEQTGA